MTAHIPAPIHLHDRADSSTPADQKMLLSVVDQLNVVTERLHALESQIANGTVIITEAAPVKPGPAPLRAVRNDSSGWQPNF